MKLRDLRNLPVFCRDKGYFMARIDHGIVDENFCLRYLVVKKADQTEAWIAAEDFTLTEERAEISQPACMKTGLDGENLSIYEKKCGNRIHDEKGGQIGRISDFIINPSTEKVVALEVSRGYLKDFIHGRLHIPITEIHFENSLYATIQPEGGEDVCFARFVEEPKLES